MESDLSSGADPVLNEELIAPCGMNCGVCISYLGMRHQINDNGFSRKYCPGCRPRGKHCLFMKDSCDRVGKGTVRYCFECADFPCKRLKALDKRYRTKYHLSMIANLETIRDVGIDRFLAQESDKWRCANCGDVVCCHNGLCLRCQLDVLRRKRTYRWDE